MVSIIFSSITIAFFASWVNSWTLPASASPIITTTIEKPVSKIWALLVAGSNGYANYRHQADICHAYQILKKNGIPKENIIVMMYDDIAYNPSNPNPGVIINAPNGSNVYEDVVKDYTGKDVTPENFLNVLQGKKELMVGIGSGKVIESGPTDYVFVNFADHGGPQLLGFPDNQLLHATDLISALNNMTKEKHFAKMFLYVEACESGSMFDVILKDTTNIFVMTAADPNESSFACYFDTKVGTFLGDVFSVNWMHQAEKETLSNVSLNHLFEKVRTNTSTSHVEEYGDLDIGNTVMANVIGDSKKIFEKKPSTFVNSNRNAVPQSETKIVSLQILLEEAIKHGKEAEIRKLKKMISEEIYRRLWHMKKLNKILAKITDSDSDKIRFIETNDVSLNYEVLECYKTVLNDYFTACLNFPENEFMYPLLRHFLLACDAAWTNTRLIISAIHSVCRVQT